MTKHHSCKKREYDYIIVGDGAAGCIMARKLSDPIKKDGKCKYPNVLVLEQGENQIQQFGYPPNPTILDPKLFTVGALSDPNSTFNQLTSNPKYSFTYTGVINATTLDPILQGRTQAVNPGKGWGGGSSHFYMLAFRGTPDVWDSFAAYNNDPSWSYNAVLPIFKSLETYTPNVGGCFDADQRGSHGPISIVQNTPAELVDPTSPTVNSIMKEFATNAQVGLGYTCDCNSADEPKIGTASAQNYQTTPVIDQYGQYRSWAHNSFLPIGTIINTEGKGLQDRKLTIKSNALCVRVLFKRNKAIGVEYLDTITGKKHKVYAKQIILSAGAIGNPQILQRSGVGDATLLTSLGIDVVLDNPNVGANMNNNPEGIFAFTGDVDFGPGAVITSNLHNSSLQPSDPFYYPNDGQRRAVQIVVPGDYAGFPEGTVFMGQTAFNSGYNGQVKITSTDPTTDPFIDMALFSDDTTGLVNGSLLNKLMAICYNNKVIVDSLGATQILPPAAVFASPTALADFIKGTASMQMHFVGTCRFGTSQADAVVDSNFNVFGLRNLKIADLSVYPYTVNGNPMFSALTAAVKCVESLGVPVNPIL
jgi:choline dehydrogenase